MANEEITFSWEGADYFYKDLQPLEWLEGFAHLLREVADEWDEWDPNFLEEDFEDCKEKCPDMSKIEMYSDAVSLVTDGGFHITFMDDLGGFKNEQHQHGPKGKTCIHTAPHQQNSPERFRADT